MAETIPIGERLRFQGIDDTVRTTLRELKPLLPEIMPGLLDGFYSHMGGWPEVARIIRPEVLAHVREKQLEHWMLIAEAEFGPRYEASVRKIWGIHARLGLPPSWFIGGYSLLSARIAEEAVRQLGLGKAGPFGYARSIKPERFAGAVMKAVLLDLDFAVEVYMAAADEGRRKTLDELAARFGATVFAVVETVAAASTELQASSETLSRTAQDTSGHAEVVARTADTSASNVQTVASASEEMSASIAEIAQQVGQSAQIARDAERKAAETNATVTTLAAAAEKIGKVVSLISDIAAQTNLLALNATIEAARAGDAGRGFAVVASEVKSLAEQTARATDEISNQIAEVQGATGAAVTAIDGIAATISEINEISAAISAAVEEQMAAVREITRNTGDVAAGTAEVSQAIGLVQEGASETGAAAEQALGAARELGQQANRLRSEVDGFLQTIRAA